MVGCGLDESTERGSFQLLEVRMMCGVERQANELRSWVEAARF